MGEKLLFIDDDAEVLDINKKYFESEGFEVSTAATVMEGSELLTAFRPDLIVLDVMMPGIDGFEACTLFRKRTNAPILFLSGKVEEADKIKGFESGADDYLEKPCSLPEMKARIMANIRRSSHMIQQQRKHLVVFLLMKYRTKFCGRMKKLHFLSVNTSF